MKYRPLSMLTIVFGFGIGLCGNLVFAEDQRNPDSQNDPNQILQGLKKGHQSNGVIRDLPDNLKVADMSMEELRQRLAEYEAKRRDDRDGYIIVHQLWFNYQGRKETDTANAQHAKQLLDQLSAKHPEFTSLKDFRLSDKIRHEEKLASEKHREKEEAKSWTPPDVVPSRVLVNGRRAVGVFQFHLDFWVIPNDVEAKAQGTQVIFLRQGREINPTTFRRDKSLTFAHPVETLPRFPDSIDERFLACSMMLNDRYNPMTPEERRKVGVLTGKRTMAWTNKAADQEQICAVLSVDGNIVHSFGKQAIPDTLFYPLAISADGMKWAVMVGEKVSESGEEGKGFGVGKPREILEWDSVKGGRSIPIKDRSLSRYQVLRMYSAGKFDR